MDRHFTVSVFVVHENRVLLHLHKRAKIMLPLGGHIELNELPEETCIRESKEESGLDITLYNLGNKQLSDACIKNDEILLTNSQHTIMGEIDNGHHHIDFVYFATSETNETNPDNGESDLLKWFSKEELVSEKDIQENIRLIAIEALDLLS